jgi:hypothetical protein
MSFRRISGKRGGFFVPASAFNAWDGLAGIVGIPMPSGSSFPGKECSMIPFALALSLLTSLAPASGPTIHVPAGSDAASALQHAIDACPKTGCRIELPDSQYVLRNQIWIQSKDSIELVGTFPGGRTVLSWLPSLLTQVANPVTGQAATVAALFTLRPPTGNGRPDTLPAGWLMWPRIAGKSSLPTNGPAGSATDTSNPFSSCGFQHNGMFLVKNSAFTSFRHLTLDGIRPAIFINTGIWSGLYSVLGGNVGVSFFQSLHGSILDCELKNFWSAMYLNDRNYACFALANASDTKVVPTQTLQGCGSVGGHLVEGNLIHGNWWGAYSESAWDLGSTFRSNQVWDCRNQQTAHAGDPSYKFTTLTSDGELANNIGGFLFEKDVVFAAHTVAHNTFRGVLAPYAWGGYRAAGHALWSDNIVGAIPGTASSSFLQQLQNGSGYTQAHIRRNTFEALSASVVRGPLKDVQITDSTYFASATRDTDTVARTADTIWHMASNWYASVTQPDSVITQMNALGALPFLFQAAFPGYVATFHSVDAKGIDHLETGLAPYAYDSVGFVKIPRLGTVVASLDSSWRKNLYAAYPRFLSDDSTVPDYFRPDLQDRNTARAMAPAGGIRGALGSDGANGSHLPTRAWVTGSPWWDTIPMRLHLPISLDARGRSLDKYVVREGLIASMHIKAISLAIDKETVLAFPVPDPIAADAHEIVLPFLPTSDALFQVDLWLAGISGTDTLPASPISWVWAPGMHGKEAGHLPTVGMHGHRGNVILGSGRDQRGWYADVLASSGPAFLIAPDGRKLPARTESRNGSERLHFPGATHGIWILTIATGRQKVLVTP